jgi:glucose-6-phosphate 1-dehydrogenase
MVQNHMMQLLSLVAMEPPVAFEGEAVRDEKVKVIRSLRPIPPAEVNRFVFRGQYGPGFVGGRPVPGYRQEPGVAPDSVTETFLALRLEIDNWRWAGVPFFLRSGKRLPRRASEIAIQFLAPPHRLFPQAGPEVLADNVLALRIQPDEGISIRFGAKVPGPQVRIQPVKMDFLYGSSFGVDTPDAYERLLLDCLLGEATLFIRRDEVEGAWSFVQNILDGWANVPPPEFPNYVAGTWGPEEADTFIEDTGRQWRRL